MKIVAIKDILINSNEFSDIIFLLYDKIIIGIL